jgi:DNA-binding GntR family transcriptional regulator
VREAFQMLASDGLIQLRPNKGAVVLGITRKTIIDHYQARAILERESAAAVCRNNADISAIIDAHEQAREALMRNDSRGYSDYNQAFHNAIWDAAGNEKIKSLLASMWNGLSMGHKITEDEYAKISNREHQLIVDAIVDRDEARAMKLMNDHIIRSMENILTRFSED